MLQQIPGLPSNVVGFTAIGEVQSEDYENVLRPAISTALETHERLRLLYVLGAEFTGYSLGAMWEDTKLGISDWSVWDKIALVTDHKVYADAVKVFGRLAPGEVKVYPVAELADATAWVAE